MSTNRLTFAVAGVTFEGRQSILSDLRADGVHRIRSLIFRPEPDNPHDPNAIAVLAGPNRDLVQQIGYVPRDMTSVVRAALDAGWTGRVESIGSAGSGALGSIVALFPPSSSR